MGYFITFEGVEGCGKTTQIKMLSDNLLKLGYSTKLTREPGGCKISDKIRSILLDAENSGMSPLTELMLYAAARAQHIEEVIVPSIESNKIVLCDRFSDATVAYQSYGRGIDISIISTLNSYACQGITPDLTVLVDCEPSLGLMRARKRIEESAGPREERFELETLAFHNRVRKGYLQLASEQSDRFLIVDGSDTIEAISAAIATKVLPRIPEKLRAVC
ncbi:MAG: dTMP kinase [Desulfuromonadaceae bacterium]|nr:dTMP kinase [Desulfuromonadaceae bacterium]MDD2854475.1 dTMP kinase [Desulfuromonadaceae bacterium]